MKLIIVDDEMLIRKLIRMKLDTEKLGIEIVGEFGDSASALDSILELDPDIVLSDICMPGDDGISFSEKITQMKPGAKVIIITGYNDFEYARRSIKAGVFDYLMKPVQAEELNACVKRAYEEILRENSKTEQQQKLEEEWKVNLSMLRAAFINELLVKESVEGDIRERLNSYEIEVDESASSGLIIGIVTVKEIVLDPKLPILMEKEVTEFFSSEKYICVVKDSWGRIMVLCSTRDFPMQECLGIVTNVIIKKYGCHVSFAVSDVYGGWADAHQAYLSALNNLQISYSGKSSYECVADLKSDEIVRLLEKGETGQAREKIMSVLYSAPEDMSCAALKQKIQVYLRALKAEISPNEMLISFENEYEFFTSRSELEWWMNAQMIPILIQKKNMSDNDLLMKNVVTYIYDNLDNPDMNQNTLANEFAVSSSHLSRLFKQYLGRTYVNVVTDFRMVKMITLLHSTNLKDRDIGIEIGIPDAHYLSIWFRKITGVSVSEYRKLIVAGEA